MPFVPRPVPIRVFKCAHAGTKLVFIMKRRDMLLRPAAVIPDYEFSHIDYSNIVSGQSQLKLLTFHNYFLPNIFLLKSETNLRCSCSWNFLTRISKSLHCFISHFIFFSRFWISSKTF